LGKLKNNKYLTLLLLIITLVFFNTGYLFSVDETSFEDRQKRIEIYNQYKDAVHFFEYNNYSKAFEIFAQIWDDYKEKIMILHYINIFVNNNNKHAFLKSRKDLIKYYLNAAKHSFQKKEYIKALDYYNRILILDQNSLNVQFRIKEIEDIINNMLMQKDDFNLPIYHYANAYNLYVKGNIVEFLAEAKKVLILTPDNKEIQNYVDLLNSKTNIQLENISNINISIMNGIKFFYDKKYSQSIKTFCKVLAANQFDEIAIFYLTYMFGKNYFSNVKIKEIEKIMEKQIEELKNLNFNTPSNYPQKNNTEKQIKENQKKLKIQTQKLKKEGSTDDLEHKMLKNEEFEIEQRITQLNKKEKEKEIEIKINNTKKNSRK
jgi:tetratricopeptide (TPR) repeat protein